MKLYNTQTRSKDRLDKQIGEEVTLYTCGPTVYLEPHIGNWRTFIFYDTLARSLRYLGYRTKHVLNITDVGHLTGDVDSGEDKLEQEAKKEQKSAWDVANHYTKLFVEGMARLQLSKPDMLPRATEHIAEQIELVQQLLEEGYAYQTDQAVYFDVSKFDPYGKLSGQNLSDKQTASRADVVTDPKTKNPQDFALWFFTVGRFYDHQMRWPSPWGEGFPGWHIECSAMAKKYLGDTIDIHAGGVDHIGTHHENEIAQSEAANAKPLAMIWLHAEHMLVDNQKMSKSLGNVILLNDIAKKSDLLSYKLLMLSSHYRSQQNFTLDALAGAAQNLYALQALADRKYSVSGGKGKTGEYQKQIDLLRHKMTQALSDDLNTPEALSAIYAFSASTDHLPLTNQDVESFSQIISEIESIFALGLSDQSDLTPDQKQLIAEREDARGNNDYSTSDELRTRLASAGIFVEDTDFGPRWRRKKS